MRCVVGQRCCSSWGEGQGTLDVCMWVVHRVTLPRRRAVRWSGRCALQRLQEKCAETGSHARMSFISLRREKAMATKNTAPSTKVTSPLDSKRKGRDMVAGSGGACRSAWGCRRFQELAVSLPRVERGLNARWAGTIAVRHVGSACSDLLRSMHVPFTD